MAIPTPEQESATSSSTAPSPTAPSSTAPSSTAPSSTAPSAVLASLPRALPLGGSLVAFGLPTLLLWLATRFGISWSRGRLPGPDIVNWFLWGKIVFAALFFAALVALVREQGRFSWRGLVTRFRLHAPSLADVGWSLAVLVGCGLASGGIFLAWRALAAYVPWLPLPETSPSFIRVEPLAEGKVWLLVAWLPLFFFNIAGEELWWRGYLLPRQEQAHGAKSALVHGLGLALFHLPLGGPLTLILAPYLVGLPWIVTRRGNLWCGFIVHALLNGGGFLAVLFGGVGT